MVFIHKALLLLIMQGLFHASASGKATVKCDTANDLAILLDSSASVREKGFDQAKKFAKDLASRFTISANKTRASVMKFSHYIKIAMKFKDLYSKDLIKHAVDNLTFEGSTTATSKALNTMRLEMFSEEAGARLRHPGVKLVAVVVTDGYSGNGIESIVGKSYKLQLFGVELFVVGLGPRPKTDELNGLANDPDNKHVFILKKGTSVKHLVDKVVHEICKPRVYGLIPPPPYTTL